VLSVREAVSRELEKLRVAGGIGSSLDAEVDIYCDAGWQERLQAIGDELRFVFITSEARVLPLERAGSTAVAVELEGIRLDVAPSGNAKCVRCWHHREDVGGHADHPELCGRCVDNVAGGGETRRYA